MKSAMKPGSLILRYHDGVYSIDREQLIDTDEVPNQILIDLVCDIVILVLTMSGKIFRTCFDNGA